MRFIEEIQNAIGMWANESIGIERTEADTIKKLALEEVPELWTSVQERGTISSEEIADVLILALDLCFMANINAGQVIMDKMEINAIRSWEKRNGVMRHVKDTRHNEGKRRQAVAHSEDVSATEPSGAYVQRGYDSPGDREDSGAGRCEHNESSAGTRLGRNPVGGHTNTDKDESARYGVGSERTLPTRHFPELDP